MVKVPKKHKEKRINMPLVPTGYSYLGVLKKERGDKMKPKQCSSHISKEQYFMSKTIKLLAYKQPPLDNTNGTVRAATLTHPSSHPKQLRARN